jgi:ferredoxin
MIRLWAPDVAEREVFVCGPAGYMALARATLERIGLPMTRYHQESFGAPALHMVAAATPPLVTIPAFSVIDALSVPASSLPPTNGADGPRPVHVVFARSGKTVTARQGDFLLDLAEEHDVEIDSGCRSGNCGTCKVVKTEGRVKMDEQTALSAADIADGYVLTCVGQAYGDKIVLQA